MFSDPQKNIESLGLTPGMCVADIGAGPGFYSLLAGKAVGIKGKVYAIDVQKDLLSKLKKEARREKVDNIEVIWGDTERPSGTNLKDSSVDVAIAANILFQIANKRAFITEIKRILKPKGRALIIDWTDSFEGMGPHPGHIVSPDDVQQLFKEAGFAFERRINAGSHHYGLIFSKL